MEDRTTWLSACTCQGRSADTESHTDLTWSFWSSAAHKTHGLYMMFLMYGTNISRSDVTTAQYYYLLGST